VESYIVRVYHRHRQHQSLLAGVVEIVVTGEKLAFQESGELWRILAYSGHTRGSRKERIGTSRQRRQAPAGSRSLGYRLATKTTRRKST
jgi:hypothetical protein